MSWQCALRGDRLCSGVYESNSQTDRLGVNANCGSNNLDYDGFDCIVSRLRYSHSDVFDQTTKRTPRSLNPGSPGAY